MPPKNPIRKNPADVSVAAKALTYAVTHDGKAQADAAAALVDRYVEKLTMVADPRGYLVQFYSEAFGSFCDRTAAGFALWAATDDAEIQSGVIQCPSCETDMHTVDGSAFGCPSCGHAERR